MSEALPTGVTGVQLLPCVGGHVFSQVATPREVFPTRAAEKRQLRRVGPGVLCQLPRLRETPPTDFTGEGFLTCVGSYVNVQGRRAAKLLAAGVTGVRFLTRVHPAVPLQFGPEPKGFPTEVTFNRISSCFWIKQTISAGPWGFLTRRVPVWFWFTQICFLKVHSYHDVLSLLLQKLAFVQTDPQLLVFLSDLR